jgi:hypothetical protein
MLTRLVIREREPFANGHEFPITGAYEKLVGKIYGEVDPKNRLNKVIVNIDKAARNRRRPAACPHGGAGSVGNERHSTAR